jgi:prevent-host-death family protein
MHLPDVAPVIELKRQTTKVIAKVKRRRKPLLITERGRAAAVLVDVASWEQLMDRIDLLAGIARGEQAIREGRTVSHSTAMRRLKRWLSDPKP